MNKNICFLSYYRTLSTPTDYDKRSCHAILNKRRCEYDVVKKSNRNVKCRVNSAVGR